MRKHRTQLLMLLVLLAGGAAAIASMRLEAARGSALGSERDLNAVHHDLIDITQANAGGPPISMGKLDESELARRLNSAAVVAGVLDHLKATESGSTTRLEGGDYSELTLLIRFENITLRQLTVFFQQLAVIDPGSQAKSIELSPPDASTGSTPRNNGSAAENDGEVWTADISVAYLIYAPKEAKAR